MTTAAINRFAVPALAFCFSVLVISAVRADDTAVQRDGARESIIPRTLGRPYQTQISPDLAAMSALMPPAATATSAPHYAPTAPMPMIEMLGTKTGTLGSILAAVGGSTGYTAVFSDPADRNIKVDWVPHGRMPLNVFLLTLSCQVSRTIPLSTDDRVILVTSGAPRGC
jgi:hypothetical protein